jgi:hypothetical protein
MKCTCGEHGELKVFNTFQYYYCKKCKKEIEDKDFPEEKDEKDSKNLLDDFFLDFARFNKTTNNYPAYTIKGI